MRIALIGLRGTGKSTVGKILAKRLGFEFFDSDLDVEHQAGKSIASIFADDGEPAFRKLEAEAIQRACLKPKCVLATGGGAILRPDTRNLLRISCKVIWLKASIETMLSRLHTDPKTADRRPQLTALPAKEEILRISQMREPLYRQTAHQIVDTTSVELDKITQSILSEITTN